MIDRICKVSCEEGKNGNEDKIRKYVVSSYLVFWIMEGRSML